MAETGWFYAQGDQDRGPVSDAQIRALVQSGRLQPTELVWKQGMEDWQPAGEVPGLLFAAADPRLVDSQPGRRSVSGRRSQSWLDVSWSEPLKRGGTFGQPLMLVGLVLVLTSKGCDAVGQRYVARLQAKKTLAVNRFQDSYDAQRIEIENQLKGIREKENQSSADEAKLSRLADRLTELDKERNKKQQQLRRGKWRTADLAVRDAEDKRTVRSYWIEIVFVLGSVVLSVGLLAIGFTGDGAQRWVCLVMLAIITFSIFVGGTAWLAVPGR